MNQRTDPDDKEPCWHPNYTIHTEKCGEKFAQVDDVGCPECPVSLISRYPEMDALVTEILSMDCVKDASGAVPYGQDTTKWPARWHDAVHIAEIERRRAEIAKDQLRETLR